MSWCKATWCFPPISQVRIQATFLCSTGDGNSEAGGHTATIMPCCVQAEKQVVLAGGRRGVHRNSYTALDVLCVSERAFYRERYLVPLHGVVHSHDFKPKSSPAARMPIKHLTMARQFDHG